MEATAALLVAAVALLVTAALSWVARRRRKHALFRRLGVPGPEPSLLAGNMLQLHEVHPNVALSSWIEKYGSVFGYYVGETPYLVIKDLELLKQVLIKDFQHFPNRPDLFFNLELVDKAMPVQTHKRWKELRAILSPSFSSGKIKLMTSVVDKKVDVTADVVRGKADRGEMFDIYDLFQRLTLDVIAALALAMNTRCQENETNILLDAARNFVRFLKNPAVYLVVMFPFMAKVGRVLGKHLHAGKMLATIVGNVDHVIAERMKNPQIKSNDFLQLMLEARENALDETKGMTPMSDQEISANAIMFLFAGYETTSTALAYTFHLLAFHPGIQERLYREIEEAPDCSYGTLQNLQYLEQVFSESLRLHPPITQFTTRSCTEDVRVGSVLVPKGTQVLSPVWDIHHDPDLWPDPFAFDPDRFAPENKSRIKSLAFQPFGVGPRNCIGSRFALLEAKLAIFRLLKEFRFETCEKTESDIELVNIPMTSQPKNGVWVRAVKRR